MESPTKAGFLRAAALKQGFGDGIPDKSRIFKGGSP